MSMIKIINPGSQDFDEPVMQMVKISSRGLLGSDRTAFIKRAGAKLAHDLDKIAATLRPDEPLIHMLAVGATEDYGANRNGDGFKRAACRAHHDSFVKYAHWYRNHKNKDPKKSYGRVKASEFYDPMKRIELLVALNGSPEAALRNGGLFADKEMEKLAAGKEIPVSMACKVAFDVCSYCGNKAPTQDDYCWSSDAGGMCKAGGLRDNIGALVEIDGGIHQLHADNPAPYFFDISDVFRPADRIAYVSGLMQKAASARSQVVSGAAIARALGVSLPYELQVSSVGRSDVRRLLKVAYQLADIESDIENTAFDRGDLLAFSGAVQDSDLPPPNLYQEKFASLLRAMADQQIVLPPAKFIELTTGQNREKAAATAELVTVFLPGVYGRLLADASLPTRLEKFAYAPAAAAGPEFHAWAYKQAAAYSMARPHVVDRATLAVIRSVDEPMVKTASEWEKTAFDCEPARRLAEEYALYKLGTLTEMADKHPTALALGVATHYLAG